MVKVTHADFVIECEPNELAGVMKTLEQLGKVKRTTPPGNGRPVTEPPKAPTEAEKKASEAERARKELETAQKLLESQVRTMLSMIWMQRDQPNPLVTHNQLTDQLKCDPKRLPSLIQDITNRLKPPVSAEFAIITTARGWMAGPQLEAAIKQLTGLPPEKLLDSLTS